MTKAFQIILCLGVLTFPYILFVIYLRTLEQRTTKIVRQFSGDTTRTFLDTKVWFKGFDISKKKHAFQLDPFKTLYSFNIADLYVLKDKLVVVGKSKILGKTRLLSPFIISWTDNSKEPTGAILTKHLKTELTGDNLEIQFHDPDYTNDIKLVIKTVGQQLNDEIKSYS